MCNCDEYELLLSARLDGELSPQETARLEAHLAVCPQCRALESDFAKMEQMWRELPPVPVPPDLSKRIKAAVAEDNVIPSVPAKFRRRSLHWRRWAVSAAVLAVILIGAGGLGLFNLGGAPGSTAPEKVSVQTAPDSESILSGYGAPAETASTSAAPDTERSTAGGSTAPETFSSAVAPDTKNSMASTVAPDTKNSMASTVAPDTKNSMASTVAPDTSSVSAAPDTVDNTADNSAAPKDWGVAPSADTTEGTNGPSIALARARPPQAEALALCAQQIFPDGETDEAALSSDLGEDTLSLLLPDGSRVVLTCGEADKSGLYPVTCQSGDTTTLYQVDLAEGSVTLDES